jgi:hypothetical protein
MTWSDLPFDPPRRTLRQFGGLWLVFFLFLAVGQGMVRGHQKAGLILGLLAVIVGVTGLIRPGSIRWIFVGWMVLVFPIGWLVSQTMLGLLYFGIFTPVALFFRLKGRDLLNLKPSPEKATYWSPKTNPTEASRYFQQY